jgi:type IV pilus assembly protein PilQ
VTNVEFEHRDTSDWVKVQVSGYSSYEEEQQGIGRSRLVIRGARLTEALARTLDVRAFGGKLQNISAAFDAQRRAVVIEVEHDKQVRSMVSEQEGRLSWSFFEPGGLHPSMTGVGLDGGIARKGRTLHIDDSLIRGMAVIDSGSNVGPEKGSVEQSQVEETAGFAANVLGQQPSGYSGKRMEIDLKDADVHNVLRFLADVGQVNIVTADNVSGSVTLKMRNVPWDQALDVVLQSKGLGMVRNGNIIRVAPLAQLEKEREMAIARRRQELQLAPLETRLIPVSYADALELQLRAREVLSGRGTIAVDERTNVLIARDVSGTLDQVEELVRSLDTQTPQVLVEARIIEASSRYLHDVGIQWGGDASFSPATGNGTGLAFPSSVGLAGGASGPGTPTAGLSPFQSTVQNPNFAVDMPATVGTGAGGAIGLTLGALDGNFNLNLRLSAAETSGLVRILSSPRILTLDNHEARISQGTLIPFSQVSAQGVQTTFQEAKLQLLVKPHVTADGSVSMHVKINRDEPDFNQTSARGDPTILKREAETDLLVMDGHTAVIGGIYTRNAGTNVDQVPFFGDIPLLGLLFQHRRSSDIRGELVIFLTPRIVNRSQALGR